MGAQVWERVAGALPSAGHFPNATSRSMVPGARAMGKPCSIRPALFPWLLWLGAAVSFERKALQGSAMSLQTCMIAKQTRAAAWSQQVHCLTHGKTSHDFSVTSRFKSSSKCPLAINVMRIFLHTHLLMRGPWKLQILNKCRRLFLEQLNLLCTSLWPGKNIPELGSCQSSHETNMLCDLA